MELGSFYFFVLNFLHPSSFVSNPEEKGVGLHENMEQHSGPSSGLKIDAFDQGCFQRDREVVQRLKDSNEGVDSSAVSE